MVQIFCTSMCKNCRQFAPVGAELQAVSTCGCKIAGSLRLRVQNCKWFAPAGAELLVGCTYGCINAGGLHLRVQNCRISTPAPVKLQKVTFAITDLQTVSNRMCKRADTTPTRAVGYCTSR
jgi:hypothetical protein